MTRALEKAFKEAAKLLNEDQDIFADFILEELAFRTAVREGIEAADRGEVVSLEEEKNDPKMGFKIVFTKPAILDLENLVAFISRDNPQAAEQFGYALVEKAEKLSESPFLGRVVPEFKIESLREISTGHIG